MTISKYKYIVSIEGLKKPMEFSFLIDALHHIQMLMPCKATIEAKEE